MNNWISVKDQLPEEIGGHYSKRVLVFTTSGLFALGYIMRGKWERDGSYKNFEDSGYVVTHWQSLPLPPTHTPEEQAVWDMQIGN